MTGYWSKLASPSGVRERFDAKWQVDEAGCHNWIGYVGRNGYGRFKADGAMRQAHRVAYVLAFGSIPDGLEIDHLCRNRGCVNPAHLEPVTKFENQRRSPLSFISAQTERTSCPQGHEDYFVRCDGARTCRTCVNARARAYGRRKRAIA